MTIHKLKVTTDSFGQRIDIFVSKNISELSRARIKSLIESDNITVNGSKVKASYRVRKDDIVCVEVPPPVTASLTPENIPLNIIYEDNDIIVVNKKSGMVVHPAAGHPNGTLVNALLYHCKNLSGIGGELKPGIVHRLDMGTSGVIIAAKNDESHKNLSAQFKDRTVSKTYYALVCGWMKNSSGHFDSAIGRSVSDRKRMSSHTKRGRASLTEWKVVEKFAGPVSLVQIALRTGRMHQIRVHFTEAGHPLVGDSVYGGGKRGPSFSRPALHATKLCIDHPRTHKRMEFESPIPTDINNLLIGLRKMV